jgi:hypothetical protein
MVNGLFSDPLPDHRHGVVRRTIVDHDHLEEGGGR